LHGDPISDRSSFANGAPRRFRDILSKSPVVQQIFVNLSDSERLSGFLTAMCSEIG
jgi:hypothetical protein